MTDELPLICVIIYRKEAKFSGLSDIMQNSCSKEQIPVKLWIRCAVVVTELGYAKCVLQKSTDKAMVYGLCCTGFLKGCDELLIFYKELLQKLLEIRIFDAGYN